MEGYMLIGGEKVFKDEEISIYFPYNGELVGKYQEEIKRTFQELFSLPSPDLKR